jgi:hypothetical protein
MGVSSELIAARREWEDPPRPLENFRTGRTSALTYDIECDLDHQLSYIDTMLQALSDWNPHWDFEMRAQHELRDLAENRSRIEALELPRHDAEPLLRYAAATERLLSAVLREATTRKSLGR